MNEFLSVSPLNDNEQITVSMATIPEREIGMECTIEALLPQCDHFDVCLNGYPIGYYNKIFDDPKVNVIRQPRETGPRGKFYYAARTCGYFITADDDIVYPPNYVWTTIQGIEKYKRQAVVAFHGLFYAEPQDGMQPSTYLLVHMAGDVSKDVIVHHLGTGTMGYHTDLLRIKWHQLLPGKIDDQVGWIMQQSRIPAIVLAHQKGWLEENPATHDVCALKRNADEKLVAFRREHQRERVWKLYVPETWKEVQKYV